MTLLPYSGPRKFGYSRKLVEALVRADLDVVDCHGLWMYTSYACLSWARKTSRPYVVTPHGMLNDLALKRSSMKKAIASLLYQRRHLKEAGLIRALSAAEAASVRTLKLGIPIAVIPNAVDPPTDAQISALRRNDSRFRDLLYLGRLDPEKGIETLLCSWEAATKRLGSKAAEWRLVICGWGEERYVSRLRKRALSLGERVEFRGIVLGAAKDEVLANASGFVLPSLREALPVAVLEAWSYGLPVVMSRECNLPEGFHAGAAVECPLDAEGMTASLCGLVEMSASERTAMGRRGRALVLDRFCWRSVISSLVAAYTWLSAGENVPGCVER